MGPNFKDNSEYETKLDELENNKLDETYCFLYIPKDVETLGSKAAVEQKNSSHKYSESPSENRMSFSHLKIKEIRNYMYEIYAEELFKVIDIDEFVKSEIENKGIVVIDEIDKLVRSADSGGTTKASDEGVQYDLLPILDGTTVNVSNKMKVSTRNILFVGGGAFEKVKPNELAIELQGRLPINAKMESLTEDDFL